FPGARERIDAQPILCAVLDGGCARRHTISAAGTEGCSAGPEPRDEMRVVIERPDGASDERPRHRQVAGRALCGAVALALALLTAGIGGLGVTTPAAGQGNTLNREQAAAQAAYGKALSEFKAVLTERRAQIEARERLPERPGQALYLARLA